MLNLTLHLSLHHPSKSLATSVEGLVKSEQHPQLYFLLSYAPQPHMTQAAELQAKAGELVPPAKPVPSIGFHNPWQERKCHKWQ